MSFSSVRLVHAIRTCIYKCLVLNYFVTTYLFKLNVLSTNHVYVKRYAQ